jgi:hypothetical protein
MEINSKLSNCILIPTYIPHFDYVKNLIKSIHRFSKDNSIDIFIVVTSNDEKYLNITEYNNIKVHILTLKNIINYLFNDIYETDLNHYQKFTYQSLKKIFSIYYVIKKLNYKYVYVLDSEGLFFRPFSLSELIEGYSKNKRVFYNSKQRIDNIQSKLAENLCHSEIKVPGWLLENYLWIYEDVILKDFFHYLFNGICDTNSLLNKFKNDIFIEVVYYYFIFINNDKYNYTFVDSYETSKKYLSDDNMTKIINSDLSLLEDIRVYIDDKNINSISKYFNDYSIINFKFMNNDYNFEFLKKATSILLINSGDYPLFL